MPRIVLIIDEFADLMMRDKKGVGEKICGSNVYIFDLKTGQRIFLNNEKVF